MSGFAERVAKPFQALVQAVAGGGAGALDVPGALAEGVETQLVGDFRGIHGILCQVLARHLE